MFAADIGRCWGVEVRRLRPLRKRASRAFMPAAVLWPERGSCLPRLKDRLLSRLLSVFRVSATFELSATVRGNQMSSKTTKFESLLEAVPDALVGTRQAGGGPHRSPPT